jgi:hypothetical protein
MVSETRLTDILVLLLLLLLLLLQEEMNSWLGRINTVITESQQSPGAARSSQTLPARGVSPEAEARKKERAKKTKTMLPA